jgi:ATP-dependent Zn protease
MTQAIAHCDRPWWKRPPTWFIAIATLLLLIFAVVEMDGRTPATPYGTFLDQLAAGNVASVTFQGTEINGRFKRPVGETGAGQLRDVFHSRVPDFGDATLIAELRGQQVVIDVTTPSPWTWLLGRVPWPMLAILAVMLVAALTRMLRGGPPVPGSAMPAHGMGMIGLLSGLFARQRVAEEPSLDDGKVPKSR